MKNIDKNSKNAGFTLVELVIVVAIFTLLIGSGISMMGLLNGKDAKETQTNITSILGKARIETMSKKSLKLEIYKDDANGPYFWRYIVDGVTDTHSEQIATKRVIVRYEKDNSGTYIDIAPGASLILEFDRSSGALKAFSDGTYCTGIRVSQGSVDRNIQIFPATGRYKVG